MSAERPTREVLLVLGQLSTIAALVLAALLVAIGARAAGPAGRSVIGRTWPIAEPDALAELEARAARMPRDISARFGRRSRWSALRSAPLGVADRTRMRSVVPFYTLEREIRLPDGTLLYPSGFTFNPLIYVTLAQRLIVVHARDLGWALRTAQASDFILLSARPGEPVDMSSDAVALGAKNKRAIFILEDRVKARLGLTVAPVIIRQSGQKLVLAEIGLKRPAATDRTP